MNYFRITAYYEAKDFSVIIDSNGKFDKLYDFAYFLMDAGFDVLELGKEDKFLFGDLEMISPTDQLVLRAGKNGKPVSTIYSQDGTRYKAIDVGGKIYVPNRNTPA